MGHLSLALMYANEVLSDVNAGPTLVSKSINEVGLTYGSLNRTPFCCWDLLCHKKRRNSIRLFVVGSWEHHPDAQFLFSAAVQPA
jgi:hypothetical protein